MLDKILRSVTLSGQYDWWLKKYTVDSSSLPEFLPDIPELASSLFGMTAQIGIVNIYSPGDALAPMAIFPTQVWRRQLFVSLGFEALFITRVGEAEGLW